MSTSHTRPMQSASSSLSGTPSHPTPPRPSIAPMPSNQDIEAVIQMATSAANSRPTSAGSGMIPGRDTRTQLFVGNLPYRVRWQDLKDLFRKAGTVLRADVSLGPDNRSRGYGTVLLATAEDAGRAIDKFNGYSWQTRTLEVRPDRIPADLDLLLPQQPASFSSYISSPSYPFANAPSVFSESLANEILSRSAISPSTSLPLNLSNAAPGLLGPSSPTQLSQFPPQLSISRSVSRAGNPLSALNPGGLANGRSLFVGNLPFQCQWQDLKDLFRQVGPVVRADVALGPDGRSRGFGTVLFQTDADAEQAVLVLNGYDYNGRVLKVHHDRFNPMAPSALPSPSNSAFTINAPPLQQAASFMGSLGGRSFQNHGIPSHMHQQSSAAYFHSQPTSPFESFPPTMTYEQYLISTLSQEVLRNPPPMSASYGVDGSNSSRPSTTQSSSGLQRPESAASSTVLSREGSSTSSSGGVFKVVDYPSLHHPVTMDDGSRPGAEEALDHEGPPPATPPTKSSSSSSTSPNNHPGTIALPPRLNSFAAPGGAMFSPRGLPPMTPSMPGFTFHPQVSTPPGPHHHFLSPGLGPTSPPFYHSGSIHAAPGGPPLSMMGGMYAMGSGGPPFTPGQHMVLTPGPRLNDMGYINATNTSPMYGPPLASPPIQQEGSAQQDYFPQVVDVEPKEPADYFPPVFHTRSSDESTSTTTTSAATEELLIRSAPHSEADTATAVEGSDCGVSTKASSDPAATIRARVAGLALADEKTMVNEIAVASGTARKLQAAPASTSLWMSQKGRFKAAPTTTPPVLDKRDMQIDLSNPGLFGLPSPGSGRRASWGDSGVRRSVATPSDSR